MSYNYYRFRKTDGRYIGILFPVSISIYVWSSAYHFESTCKFRSNRTIVGGVMTSYGFFKMAAIESEMYFRFRFSDGICLSRWKSICTPNFDEISQSTAEIQLRPFSENRRPPYWSSISGFDFDLCIVISIPLCICLPNFVVIRW